MKIFLICLAVTFLSCAPPIDGDLIDTDKGTLHIYPINHATLAMKWTNQTIYVDPVGGAERFKTFPKPDIILITDIHQDHLDPATVKAVMTDKTRIIVPEAVAEKLNGDLKIQPSVLGNGGETTVNGIKIEALPMYNLPESPDAFHVKGRGNGYLLTLGGKRIYIAGDTEGIPEMRELDNVDVAFIPMNLPYTMDVEQAADAVLEFAPKIVYPYHYRGKDGLSDVNRFKEIVNEGNSDIDVRLRDWYAEK